MENPLDSTIDKVMKDLRNGVEAAMLHLQEGIQDYLNNNIDLSKLLAMLQGMAIPNIMGVKLGSTMPGFDPYRILGLNKTATDEEVKERFRALLQKIHPDVSGVKGTEFLTQMIVTAYSMISSERKWE